jgi:similar to stage IV sporulation protein
MYKYKKRKTFAILLIIVVFIIGLSSMYVWNVDIIEENNQELPNIRQDIEEAGIKLGTLKSKINSKEIINKIRLKRNDVAWMGIEKKGTNIIVKLVKADQKPEIVDTNEYCNIVSDKTGVITKINAQNGTANVKVGDTINKGDILINGWMEGKYTGIRYVHAKGEIEAKVWYTKNKKIPYILTQTRETGNQENKYSLKINNFEINFLKKYSKFEIYDTIETDSKFRIFSDFYLPISVVKTTFKEKENYTQKYTLEEAKTLGIEELQEELKKEIKDEKKIVNKNINTYEKEDGVEIYVTYEVLENIGTNEKIVF